MHWRRSVVGNILGASAALDPAAVDVAETLAALTRGIGPDLVLEASGAASVALEDAQAGSDAETPRYAEPSWEASSAWRRHRVSALIETDADPVAILTHRRVREASRTQGRVRSTALAICLK